MPSFLIETGPRSRLRCGSAVPEQSASSAAAVRGARWACRNIKTRRYDVRKEALVVVALATGLAVIAGGGVAIASHVAEVDPATVPTGFLAAHNRVEEVPVWAFARAAAASGAEVTVQHIRPNPNQPIPWHTHPGPVFVLIERGAFTYEYAQGDRCIRTTYGASTGFVDPGFGNTHQATAGPRRSRDLCPIVAAPRKRKSPHPDGCGPGLHVLNVTPRRACFFATDLEESRLRSWLSSLDLCRAIRALPSGLTSLPEVAVRRWSRAAGRAIGPVARLV